MGQKVFLVEDSATVRMALTLGLADAGAMEVVDFAETERGAVAWLNENPSGWMLAIVDMFLKEGTGLGVLAACRDSRQPGQRVVVLTSHATSDLRERCLRLGANAFFDKASETEALIAYCVQELQPGS
ncbi:response regulator [Xylophilus rhododendri]|uniref:Response regulator n=1 Tax=Xylophilus rhododendri TaxID=2697032 RepID=A0A857JCW8_9BURK|nr:response regulator transcription factor [Xylophilus rhododendri]QHJ00813.1 response regulator [Xylophilus rhododendri]